MEEQPRTWTSEEAMGNLESLVRLDWSREELPEGVRELLENYETAIPQLTSEIRRLRGEMREERRNQQRERSGAEGSDSESSGDTTGYEDLADFARRLGLDQR